MKWRLIEQQSYSASMNMAIDHAIYESVANGKEQPTIRFYKWIPSSISIGAYQNPKEINLNACKKHNIGTVRRMTGGGAVFHDKVDFTYSVIAPISEFEYNIQNAYKQICSWIINALKELGINASLQNKNDIFVDGKKISGNAAKAMGNGVYLQHGTLIYDIDFNKMPNLLKISKYLAKEKITSVLQHRKTDQSEVYEALKNNFVIGKEFQIKKLSKLELRHAQYLAKTRYNSIILPADSLAKNKGACYAMRSVIPLLYL